MAENKAKSLSQCKINNKKVVTQLHNLGFNNGTDDMTFEEAMICAQISSAVKGNTKAFLAIQKTMGIQQESEPLDFLIDEEETALDIL